VAVGVGPLVQVPTSVQPAGQSIGSQLGAALLFA
jgi:hypothetical protein